jgi:penicillin-binding protein 1A
MPSDDDVFGPLFPDGDSAPARPPAAEPVPVRRYQRSVPRRIGRTVWIVVLCALIVPPATAGVAMATYLFMDSLPSTLPEEQVEQADARVSTVYAADGSVIGEFRQSESRSVIPAEEIPQVMKDVVIAAEDKDFYRHKGVDLRSIGRALMADFRNRQIKQGGSTITQQMVKNLYTGNDKSVARKVKEALIAAQVERVLDKEEIIAKYLNTVYMGDSVFGVEAAAQSYFKKPAKELTLAEAALLAGVLPAPSLYSPRNNNRLATPFVLPPGPAESKRQIVLEALDRTNPKYSDEQIAEAKAAKLTIHPPPRIVGKFPYFLDYVRTYLLNVKNYPADMIYRGGLKIETTLDPALEAHASKVINQSLPRPKDPESSLVSIEPQTGFVRALVGGRNWEESKVNLALGKLGGGSGRQAGSAFKPFVLARALDAGVSPSKVYSAPSCVQPKGFTKRVCNYGGGGYGSATLTRAMANSINTVFVQLIVDVGIKQTAEMAKRLGITSIDLNKPVYGGIAIGTQEVSPLDMASAYSVFAARGVRAEPTPILKITRRDGSVVEDNTLTERGERVLEEPVADNMNQILRGVVEGGTGTAAKLGRPVAGKTGTSQNYENAWFVGYTPTLATAVWMGHPRGNISMGRVTGGSVPARIWKAFMTRAVKDVEVTDFTEPAPIESLADRAKREQRGGFDLTGSRGPTGIPGGGSYYSPPPAPAANAPTTTTTLAPEVTDDGSSSSTTTTTSSGSTTTTTKPASSTTSSSTTSTTRRSPLGSSATTTTTRKGSGDN